MACTLVATKLGIKVAHVEAGLRSFDRTMPEEINRLVTDTLSDLLFTPSADADENLLREGIQMDKIKRVGNIMIDTLVTHLEEARHGRPHDRFGLIEKIYVFVTLHRPSKVDNENSISQKLVCMGCVMTEIYSVQKRNSVSKPFKSSTISKNGDLLVFVLPVCITIWNGFLT